MHRITSLHFNFLNNFHPNCLHQCLDNAFIVIIGIVYPILSTTLRHYWFNVWFPTFDAYLKTQFWNRGISWFTWQYTEFKFDGFLSHNRLCNLCYVRHYSFMFYTVRRTISNFSALYFQECVFQVMVVSKKVRFCSVASHACRFIAYASKRNFLFNKLKIYRSYLGDFEGGFDVFHLRWSDSTRSQPNHDLWH